MIMAEAQDTDYDSFEENLIHCDTRYKISSQNECKKSSCIASHKKKDDEIRTLKLQNYIKDDKIWTLELESRKKDGEIRSLKEELKEYREKDRNVPDKRVQVKKASDWQETLKEAPLSKDEIGELHRDPTLSRDEQKSPKTAIQVSDEKNEDSTPEAICQHFPTAKEHTDKSVVNDISSDKDNELSVVQDGIRRHENDEAIDDKTVSSKECEDASYKTAYSTEFCKDVSDETISLVDGSCDTYSEMEEGPAVPTNEITESSSEEPEIDGVHSSYNVDSNHLNHLKSNQDLQTFAHSLKIIKRKADSISREIRKNDGKALFCKFAPCALANLLLLLTTLQIYFCLVQLIQKLGQISLGTKFVMKILELLNNEQELNELMKEENEDWEKLMKEVNEDWEQPMKEVLAKLKKTMVMPCTNILIALQKKGFLTSIFKKEVGVGRKHYFLNTAINEFKVSQHKAGLMIYITAEKSHCVVLIMDENGEEVNIYDATINEDEVENLENLRGLQILVLTYTNDKNDKIPLIEKEWSKCKEYFCSNNYVEAHKSNNSAN